MADGFQDTTGTFPRRQTQNQSGVNPRARSNASEEIQSAANRSARVASTTPQIAAEAVTEPTSSGSPQYPHNQVHETRGGHIVEYDDTPGRERVSIQHKTGTKVEMRPDGSVLIKSKGDKYEIVAGDADTVVRGNVNIIVESNASIRCKGDMNLQTDGDFNHLVQGNYNLEVQGSVKHRIHGNEETSTTGSRLHETRGNVILRNLSNSLERTVGDHQLEIGGDYRTTVEGEIHEMSYGQYQGSYFGGLVTMNGVDAEGTEGAGSIVTANLYNTNFYGNVVVTTGTMDITGDVVIDGALDVTGTIKADGTIHAPTLEGLAKKATYADTAGSAPTGSSSPTSVSNQSAGTADARDEDPDSEEAVIDVKGTSDDYITNLDRQPVTGYNSRLLNTYEVVARARNRSLRTNQAWLQDQLDNGAILSTISSSTPPTATREGSTVSSTSGSNSIGNSRAGQSTYQLVQTENLRVNEIPTAMILTEGIGKSSKLSPNFMLSHMLAGDSLSSVLKDQAGLTAVQIAQNAQLVSYNVLEELRNKYRDTWTVSEGIYNLLPNEKVDSNSLTVDMVKGLGVGIQFPNHPNSFYFEAAQWIRNHLTFDKLVLSYIDYDPSGVNEPTLIVTIKPGANSRTVYTEFNHVKVDDNILDLSNAEL